MSKKVHFNIAKDGSVKLVDVIGAGANCQELTKGIEQALGIVDESSRGATAAAYEPIEGLKLTNEGN